MLLSFVLAIMAGMVAGVAFRPVAVRAALPMPATQLWERDLAEATW